MKKKFSLDICRLIAAFLIVAIHIYPLNTINQDLDYMFTRVFCRIGVPLFLMITGYFVLQKAIDSKEVMVSYTKKILKIYFLCILLYLPVNIYMKTYQNLTIGSLIKEILFQGTFYHLWYFPALILGIWITYFIVKKLDIKGQIVIIMLLYITGLFGDSYYGFISHIPMIKKGYEFIFSIFQYTRNGLFFTPVFLYIGYYMKKHNVKIPIVKNIIYTLIFLTLMLVEGFVLYYFKVPHHTSMYLFLIPTMISLFTLLLDISNCQNKKLRTISTLIYILHPLMLVILRFLAKVIKLENIFTTNSLVTYICVCLMSLASSIVIEKLLKKRKNIYKL